ncbi:MAG: hypothetical protein GXO42_01305 [bacterium]|nr:hypothetical protein [bacterium]
MAEDKLSVENILEKLRKINSSLLEVERRIKILESMSSKKDWDMLSFKKFLTVYLEEYKGEWIKEFVENDIEVAKGLISSVLEVLKYYSVQELLLWALPAVQTFKQELEIYKTVLEDAEKTRLVEKVKEYCENLRNRIEQIINKIQEIAREHAGT